MTLFTFNRKVWKIKPLTAISDYGTLDKDGRMGLYYTMSATPNAKGLFLHVELETISVRHIDGSTVAEWQLEQLAGRFMQKFLRSLLSVRSLIGEMMWNGFNTQGRSCCTEPLQVSCANKSLRATSWWICVFMRVPRVRGIMARVFERTKINSRIFLKK